MAFRNIPIDLTLPPGAKLIPGSGTVYIGGPKLPAEIKAIGAVGAIIFYSGSTDVAADYYYIAYFQRFGTYYLSVGYKRHSDGVLVSLFEGSATGTALTSITGPDPSNNYPTITLNQVGISVDAFNGHLQLGSLTGIYFYDEAGAKARIRLSGMTTTTPCIKGDATNTVLDKWNTDSSVQTIGGVGGFTVNQAWRITPDYLIDYRVYITGGAAFPAVNVAGYNLPGSFPTPDFITVGGHNLEAFIPACGEGGAGFYPMSIRIETTGTATIFLENNPQGNTALEAGGTFTLPKP